MKLECLAMKKVFLVLSAISLFTANLSVTYVSRFSQFIQENDGN